MSVPTIERTTKRKKIDAFHYHEVVDRTFIVMELLANALEDHPVIATRPELATLLEEAHSALFRLYQKAAEISMPIK